MFLNRFLILHEVYLNNLFMQNRDLYFIKLFLTLSYSRKHSQSLHLTFRISSARLSTRVQNELAINLAVSMTFIL